MLSFEGEMAVQLPSNEGFFLATNGVQWEGRDCKKLFHSANERRRRNKLNSLYSTLGSLLPSNNKGKLSVPAVVSRVVTYIPQLQNQIRVLSSKRDQLLAIRKDSQTAAERPSDMKSDGVLFDVRVSVVAKKEVVVTIQYPVTLKVGLLLSAVFVFLEQQKMDVLNASSFVSDRIVWHTLQLKVMERSSLDLGSLRPKILRLCEESRGESALLQQNFQCF